MNIESKGETKIALYNAKVSQVIATESAVGIGFAEVPDGGGSVTVWIPIAELAGLVARARPLVRDRLQRAQGVIDEGRSLSDFAAAQPSDEDERAARIDELTAALASTALPPYVRLTLQKELDGLLPETASAA